MTWYQPQSPDRVAAWRDEEGRIILAFGKHEGRALRNLPTHYLQWLTRGNGYVPEGLQALAGNIIRDRADGPVWWATNAPGRQVAHQDRDSGAIIVDFGGFKGKPLQRVTTGYLRWMVGGRGSETLPQEVKDFAADELRRRKEEAVADRTPEITIDGREFIEWAHAATAAEMQSVLHDLRTYATVLDSSLTSRADTLLKGLLHED